jgi:4-hydroxybenzoate polyprenyltransferase
VTDVAPGLSAYDRAVSQAEHLADVVALPARRSPSRALLAALRPRQWVKNLLLFAGILFAAKLGEPWRFGEAVAAFAAYCAASSAAYLVNDVRDADDDRRHPVKRRRPVAARELTSTRAIALAVLLSVTALALTLLLGLVSVALLLAFCALQAGYTWGLKHLVLVDVAVIAGLFVIRAAAGAVAVDVRISPWLLVCTGLLALFLALGKRRAELVLVERLSYRGRPVLDGYSIGLVEQLLTMVAAATIASYAVYTVTAHETRALAATIPFVVFGLSRYLLLLHRRSVGEEPENVLLGDVPILATVAVWAVTCAAVLSF